MNKKAGAPPARNSARLAAVQALYEIDSTDAPVDPVLTEFLNRRWQDSITDEYDQPVALTDFDHDLLASIVQGVSRDIHALDTEISENLSEKWTMDRLELIMRAILRAATFELKNSIKVPVKVVISEYMDIAAAFYSTNEPALVNGVLNQVSKRLRPRET